MSKIAVNCIEDLETRVKRVALLTGRTFHVFSEADIMAKTRNVTMPCAGIGYLGLTPTEDGGKSSVKMGISAILTASIMVFFRQQTFSTADQKDEIIQTMDSIRSEVIRTRSPSGHFWEFKAELPGGAAGDILSYVQRWATPVQLGQ